MAERRSWDGIVDFKQKIAKFAKGKNRQDSSGRYGVQESRIVDNIVAVFAMEWIAGGRFPGGL